ncbi:MULTISPECIES: DUF998 domain-containing protein [unclassified Brevibacterium]|uniref:DUF998 domain-containing protein n=1 Tax=unclassified Brevibacterium TaxID=2614124 RepID=UPI00143D04D0|nr:DUF998 domain-containing protein [Brevibacterium sp. S22]
MAGSGTIRVSPKPERVWALLAVLASLATLLIEIPAALLSEGGYSFTQQPISHLGVTGCGDWGDAETPMEVCSPAHPFVNGVSIMAGAMLAIIAFIWHDWIAPSRWGRCGSFLLAAGGMLLAATGMVPADIDPTLHAVFGFGGAAVQNLGLVAAGLAMTLWPEKRWVWRVEFGRLTIILATVGLVGTLLLSAPTGWGLPIGLIERIAAHPFLIWFILAGWMQLRDAARRHRELEAGA